MGPFDAGSGRPDLVEQVGVAIEHPQQLHQCQWRLGLAVLVSRKRVDSAAENFGGFALVEGELLAHVGNEAGIDNRRIDLASPETPTMSFVLAAVPLLVTMLGSAVRAWVFSRRSLD